ncbi:MAG: CoA transferase [Deltaproteobacteria bacterium]|nr:CoA transferase [Deltaproteobacteria bacterium]
MAVLDNNGIFCGIRVLDLTQYIAGPMMGKLLSDLGADVIKIEIAPQGDMMRYYGPPRGQSAVFLSENRGKKSLCFDLKRTEGTELMQDLVQHADVLIENWTPGVLAKYGVSYELLAPINPRLIMCSLSGFGQTGPHAALQGNDLIAFAASGILNMVGYPDDSPLYPGGGSLADSIGGVHGFAAVCAALYHRERTGKGQYIDLALTDSLMHLTSALIATRSLLGAGFKPMRSGAHLPGLTPCGIFKARDGYVAITVLLQQFDTFARLIGKPGLSSDPRFDTPARRNENRSELIRMVEEWLQSFPNRDEPIALIRSAHILCAPVLDTEGVMNDQHNRERNSFQEIDQPGAGNVTLPKAPFRFSETSVEVRGRAPLMGEDNEAVLGDLLAYSPAKIEQLTKSGVLFKQPPEEYLRGQESNS